MSENGHAAVNGGNGDTNVGYQWFYNREVLSSLLLLFASVSAVFWANSFLSETYHHLLHTRLALIIGHGEFTTTFLHWVNDGLMTLFFFTVGLEIKREIMVGELASPKMALLPVIAAAGGMLVPGLIYFGFNYGTPYMGGWGIPVATDIAFALGAIALLGRKLPVGLRIFLAAFAIADDLGAVMIIALFYTKEIVTSYLVAAIICVFLLLMCNLLWVRRISVYLILGLATWIAVMGSGVHATVAGVVVALLIPARARYSTARFARRVNGIMSGFEYKEHLSEYWYAILLEPSHLNAVHSLEQACHDVETPLQRLEHALHPWVAFLILPIFAFGNAGLSLSEMSFADSITHPVTLGILLGLFVGKPVGVTLASLIAVRSGVASMPEGVRWSHIIGASMLGGIGFTMSLFIAGLSFVTPDLLNVSKLGVLSGSILSGVAGLSFLIWDYRRHSRKEAEAAAA
jgi:Na+:H+ antiporter, NhaA family